MAPLSSWIEPSRRCQRGSARHLDLGFPDTCAEARRRYIQRRANRLPSRLIVVGAGLVSDMIDIAAAKHSLEPQFQPVLLIDIGRTRPILAGRCLHCNRGRPADVIGKCRDK